MSFQYSVHQLDSNEMVMEKDRLELHKNATFSLKNILEPAAHKTAVVQPHTSHRVNHKRRKWHAGHCWWNKNELISEILL